MGLSTASLSTTVRNRLLLGAGACLLALSLAGLASMPAAGAAEKPADKGASAQTAGEKGSDAKEAAGDKGAAEAGKDAEAGGPKVSPTPGGVVYEGGDTAGTLAAAPDWTLVDQDGVEHKLEDYRGKIVFLNFWTTWCPYCVVEMPDIQKLYEQYGENEGDVVILGVANPVTDEHPKNSDVPEDEVVAFFKEQGCSYPVLMDYTSEVYDAYKVYYLPTTYLIDPYGNVFGSITGGMDEQMMETAIERTLAGDLEKRLTM